MWEEAWGDYGYGLLPGVYYLVAKPNIYEGYKPVDAEDVTIYVKTTLVNWVKIFTIRLSWGHLVRILHWLILQIR